MTYEEVSKTCLSISYSLETKELVEMFVVHTIRSYDSQYIEIDQRPNDQGL